MLEVVMTVC